MALISWQESSYSASSSNCVNIAAAEDGTIRLRESEAPVTVLTVKPATLRGLIRALKAQGAGSRP
ncbi:DUF397 domain-containing protein [Streptomyces cinnamoneus]|uniref:DUF397 domain-containing protein n=1 Tax=Streptomyces cinnamoneus TaxID=53446 RepID=UPI0033C39BA3